MNTNLNNRDFSSSNLNSPAEKMRAMAIIAATDDTAGLNKIGFSLTVLLQKSSFKDACYVMGQWATEPVRRSPGKYIRFPAAGKEALKTRANALLGHLSGRPDLTDANIHSLKSYIHNTIDQEITYLGNHGSMAQSA